MTAYLLEWVNLLLRWAHVITAVAWIGASFYFVMLDNSLTRPEHDDLREKGVDGELWSVHGGGFYHANKYLVAPRWLPLPTNLHWSYWESYSTWLTGFALLTVLYFFNASTFLIDRTVLAWSPAAAVSAAVAMLVVFWLAYDAICRVVGVGPRADRLVGLLVAALVGVTAWVACHLFAGRAAFLLVGATLATAMSANVFFWIIPGQRAVVAQIRAGEMPDPIHGQRGKQRSVHNTYFTLPVIIAMLSNHYGWLHQAPANWVVLVALMLSGALIRHGFVARHRAHALGLRPNWTLTGAGLAVLLALVLGLAPRAAPSATNGAAGSTSAVAVPSMAEVMAIVQSRCTACHNAELPSKGVALHTTELVQRHAQQIYQQAVVLRQMPLNNATGITDAERDQVKRWFEARN